MAAVLFVVLADILNVIESPLLLTIAIFESMGGELKPGTNCVLSEVVLHFGPENAV